MKLWQLLQFETKPDSQILKSNTLKIFLEGSSELHWREKWYSGAPCWT